MGPLLDNAWEGDSDASDNDLEADKFAAAEGEGETLVLSEA